MSEDLKDSDMISFGIIANSGDARSYAFQALASAKDGDFETAEELMKKSDESIKLAHKVQSDLLFAEMNGKPTEVNVILVHSQDHLMTAMLANELIKELIELYKKQPHQEKDHEQYYE